MTDEEFDALTATLKTAVIAVIVEKVVRQDVLVTILADNAQEVWDILVSRGIPKAHADRIVANAVNEISLPLHQTLSEISGFEITMAATEGGVTKLVPKNV